ncbi:MAG: transcriptional regulator, LysR family [Chthoniobacteraceae bacterium]|nr:transcriptional regulator, LysR family [Chthoniobacteraceae bacterium]
MNEFWATTPFDLYELHLFRLVVTNQSFTKAAEIAGLTQSALTRQIQGIEKSLGLKLLVRTTRSVRVTPAGAFLLEESEQLLANAEQSLRRLREEFAGARKEVHVGVSRSISLAYLPGFFHSNLRNLPEVGSRVSYLSSSEILSRLESNDLDLGVLCPPKRLPPTVRVTHRFADAFTLIASRKVAATYPGSLIVERTARIGWLLKQNWLLLEQNSNTGQQLKTWMDQQGVHLQPAMQLDSFDLIINLVALGMGVSVVPIRALALYGRKRSILRLPMETRFVRELVVVAKRHGKIPEHLTKFISNVLF